MRTDGSQPNRLTTLNVNRKDPENTGVMLQETLCWDVQDSLVKQTGLVKVVRFTCP